MLGRNAPGTPPGSDGAQHHAIERQQHLERGQQRHRTEDRGEHVALHVCRGERAGQAHRRRSVRPSVSRRRSRRHCGWHGHARTQWPWGRWSPWTWRLQRAARRQDPLRQRRGPGRAPAPARCLHPRRAVPRSTRPRRRQRPSAAIDWQPGCVRFHRAFCFIVENHSDSRDCGGAALRLKRGAV